MQGRRVLIVGASSGIGSALARAIAGSGGCVAVSARRLDRLQALVETIDRGHAIAGDASDAGDAHRVAQQAAAALGGLDLMVYVAGIGVLQPLVETDPEVWASVLGVNVIGANLATAAALDHMDRNGLVAFVSSRAVGDANALFSNYSASKAALDQCIRTWRVEHPDRRFLRVVMGNCQPTEFADHMNHRLFERALRAWGNQAIPGGLMHVDDAAGLLAEMLAASLDHPNIDCSELKLDARVPDPVKP